MERIFEIENPYQKVGFPRNPFKMELELETLKQVAFQREANRIYGVVDKNPQQSYVIWLDPQALVEDEIDFYSYLFRSFLNCPEEKFFVFDIPGSFFSRRGSRTGFEAITSRIFEGNAGRIFYSYIYSKLLQAKEDGVLKDRLPSFEDAESFLNQIKDTKGQALADVLFYEPEEKGEEQEAETVPEESSGGEVEESSKEKTESEEKEDINLKKKDELARFLVSIIDADNIGEASKAAIRTTVLSGLEVGMTSFLSRDARTDLIGIMRLLQYAYSRLVCFLIGVGNIPFLDEDRITEYTAIIAEQDMLLKRSANICYILKTRDEPLVKDLMMGKESIQTALFPEILKNEGLSKESFRDLTLYLLGAFEVTDTDLLSQVEEAASVAYECADGDWKDGLRSLEKAFDSYVLEASTIVDGVKKFWS